MSHDTGGSAFPYAAVHGCNGEYGMTLRDYFAAKAIQGMLSACDPDRELDIQGCAQWCYRMADAMLKARNK